MCRMEMRRSVLFRDKLNTSATHAEKPPVAINIQAYNGSRIAYYGAYLWSGISYCGAYLLDNAFITFLIFNLLLILNIR